ncbi:hypothetical protein C8Q77DRAFT_1207922 [Trametes polyzona]|nr:hypothetical protein C8Q77DRAFT_1207922 [Trametes polyzona]
MSPNTGNGKRVRGATTSQVTGWFIGVKLEKLRLNQITRDQFVDLSDSRAILLDPAEDPTDLVQDENAMPVYFHYNRRADPRPATDSRGDSGGRVLRYVPFPVNTRGFFYYHQHPIFPPCGALRFHVSPSGVPGGPRLDLQTEYGTPWQIPLLAIATNPALARVRRAFERQRLVPAEVWAQCEALAATAATAVRSRLGGSSQVVCAVGEPFYVDLRNPDGFVFVVGDKMVYAPRWRQIFARWRGRYWEGLRWKYTGGILRCSFKYFYYGDKRDIGLMVHRIVEPVTERAVDNEHATFAQDPQGRQFLRSHRGSLIRPFHHASENAQHVRECLVKRSDLG